MVRRPSAIKVGTEVVVRNDNTSTDVSIIPPRGIPYAIRYFKTAALCNAFLEKTDWLLNGILFYSPHTCAYTHLCCL